MFGLIKNMLLGLLISIVTASNHIKCVSLSNQKCMIQPTFINLHPNECSQEFHYYLFAVKLDRCVGSCNTLNDLSSNICVPNKTEELNLNFFNMSIYKCTKKTCQYKFIFYGKKVIRINGGITINVDVNAKNVIYVKKIF